MIITQDLTESLRRALEKRDLKSLKLHMRGGQTINLDISNGRSIATITENDFSIRYEKSNGGSVEEPCELQEFMLIDISGFELRYLPPRH